MLFFNISNANHAQIGHITHAIFFETQKNHEFFHKFSFHLIEISLRYSDNIEDVRTHHIIRSHLAQSASWKFENIKNDDNAKIIINIDNLNKIHLENLHNNTESSNVVVIANNAAIELICHIVSQDWKISNKYSGIMNNAIENHMACRNHMKFNIFDFFKCIELNFSSKNIFSILYSVHIILLKKFLFSVKIIFFIRKIFFFTRKIMPFKKSRAENFINMTDREINLFKKWRKKYPSWLEVNQFNFFFHKEWIEIKYLEYENFNWKDKISTDWKIILRNDLKNNNNDYIFWFNDWLKIAELQWFKIINDESWWVLLWFMPWKEIEEKSWNLISLLNLNNRWFFHEKLRKVEDYCYYWSYKWNWKIRKRIFWSNFYHSWDVSDWDFRYSFRCFLEK